MINLDNISLSFGDQTIVENLSLNIQTDQRLGLVGRNGSGKSTMLEVIAGTQSIDKGQVSIARSTKIAYLPQDVVLASNKSVLHEAFSTYAEAYALWVRAQELEKLLEDGTADNIDDIVEEYGNIQLELIEHKHEELIANAKSILTGLQFAPEKFDAPVDSLSVGWKMRLVLAKLLLQKADFYLFDEPTNHLDILAQEWFLNFLKESSFGFMLVCHERYFLDELCTHTLALDRGDTKVYTGGYTSYEQQKEMEKEAKEVAYAQQQKEIKRKLATAERFRASANKAKMAQSIFKQVERIERIEIEHEQKNINIKFNNVAQPGKVVLTTKDLSFAYEGATQPIFQHISFQIERGERVALIGPNGRGKTTLFNVVSGKFKQHTGTIEFGYNVAPTVFEQDQNKALNPNNTILDEVSSVTGAGELPRARGLLGAFLFTGDDVNKKISVLSGGEKNRVAMVKTLMQNANLLMLDEPTNHLDIPSKEVLSQALTQYPGTLLFVSHDRDFLNRLATRVIDLTPNGIYSYAGNFDDYLYQVGLQNAQRASEQKKTDGKKKDKSQSSGITKEVHDDRKEATRLLGQIDRLERAIEQERERLGELEYGTKEFDAVMAKLTKLEKEHAGAFVEWEAAEAKLRV